METTTATLILFWVSAIFAVLGALGTVFSQRPLRAAMALLLNIVSLAGLYLTLTAPLLATIQLMVYAGAVVVLFVFVIMLIGPEDDAPRPPKAQFARIASAAMLGFMTLIFVLNMSVDSERVRPPSDYGTVEGVGQTLFRMGLVPFEVISITLTVAIIGAIAIARGRTPREAAEVEAAKARHEALHAETEN